MRNRNRSIRRWATGLLAVTGLSTLALSAAGTAANASVVTPAFTPHSFGLVAHTHLYARPDSGGNGNWALDNMDRTLRLRLVGYYGHVFHFQASVRDDGTFRTIRHAFTPNQFGHYAGQHIRGSVDGTVDGGTTYTFTADHLPNAWQRNLGVDRFEFGAPTPGSDETTSLWFEQAFPTGTVFTGGIDNDWSWTYDASNQWNDSPWNFNRYGHDHFGFNQNHWVDAASNNGGQSRFAGNITGNRFFH